MGPVGDVALAPMLVAYADPPYPGRAARCYGRSEVDHRELLADLVAGYPHGWALSTAADSLQAVLRLCPEGVRVCPWVKPGRRGRAQRARNAWEALLVYGGRPIQLEPSDSLSDVLLWRGRQHSHPGALIGMKPAAFAEWMFRLLGLRAGDELHDLYPGSGAIGRAWQGYTRCSGNQAPSRLSEAEDSLGRETTEQNEKGTERR